jgi:hypothetical protein
VIQYAGARELEMESVIVTYIDKLIETLTKIIDIRSLGRKDFEKYIEHMIQSVENYRAALKADDLAGALGRAAEFRTYKDMFEKRLFSILSKEEADLFSQKMAGIYHLDIDPTNVRVEEMLDLIAAQPDKYGRFKDHFRGSASTVPVQIANRTEHIDVLLAEYVGYLRGLANSIGSLHV